MILSLGTPKRRVTTPDGAIFFNDFNNTLHVDLHGVQEPVALNLGTSNWTVSQRGEVAFVFHADGIPCLAIIHPASHTRLFQQLSRHKLLDLLLLEDRFVAAIPGYLVTGQRNEDGSLSWKRMRALDCGAGFRFQIEDDGTLSYSKRGSSLRYLYDLDSRTASAVFDPQHLWNILFSQAFFPAFLPPLPDGFSFSSSDLLDLFRDTAAQHTVSASGLRLYALLSLLERSGQSTLATLQEMVALDWELQYSAGLDEPFPTVPLMDRLFRAPSPAVLHPGKLIQSRLQKWSRTHEDGTAIGVRAKPLNKIPYQDTLLEE